MSAPEDRPVMTVKEAAAVLRVDPETVRVWIRTGRLNATRLGRSWRIPADDVYRLAGGQS